MSDRASLVRQRGVKVLEAGEILRRSATEERARWLAAAATLLARRAEEASDELSEATGLSVPMIRWAAGTTLGTVREDAMLDLARDAQADADPKAVPISMLALVLAGNVFTASVRGILVPLLLGVPVLVKASSKDTRFPAMLRDALRDADAVLGESMDLVAFTGGDVECEAALVESAAAVSVYGSDETVAALEARLLETPILAHGHGVSVAYCGSGALEDAQLSQTLQRLSLDIAAYDQRGCLSPQLVYVEQPSRMTITGFARRLADLGLGPMSERLPRGPLPLSIGAAQAQWRGIAEVEGTLIQGDTYAIALRPPEPIRWSPAYRNVTLSPVTGVDEALRAMTPIGANLKCIGADPASVSELRGVLPQSPALSAYVSTLGEMQTPPIDASSDGRPIWHGLFQS